MHPTSCVESTVRTVAQTYGAIVARLYMELQRCISDKYIDVHSIKETMEEARENALMLKQIYLTGSGKEEKAPAHVHKRDTDSKHSTQGTTGTTRHGSVASEPD